MQVLQYSSVDEDELAEIQLAIRRIEELIPFYRSTQEAYNTYIKERKIAHDQYQVEKELDLALAKLNQALENNPVAISASKRTRGVLVIVERILQKHKIKL